MEVEFYVSKYQLMENQQLYLTTLYLGGFQYFS